MTVHQRVLKACLQEEFLQFLRKEGLVRPGELL
jgi:hypothetical protein